MTDFLYKKKGAEDTEDEDFSDKDASDEEAAEEEVGMILGRRRTTTSRRMLMRQMS